jgi:hypothetical protein
MKEIIICIAEMSGFVILLANLKLFHYTCQGILKNIFRKIDPSIFVKAINIHKLLVVI